MNARTRRACVSLLFLVNFGGAWAQSAVDARLASLRQRYPSGTIFLGPPALNDIRSILREPVRRKKIDGELEPIPLAARTLQNYTDSIFRASLDPTQGVVLLVIDFGNARAFEKRASDPSGGVTTLPWVPHEVRAAAILSDELIRANAAYTALVDSLREDVAKPLASWQDFQMSNANLVTDDSISTYVRLLVSKFKSDPKELERARFADPVAYRQVSALVINQNAVDNATVSFGAGPQLRGCMVSSSLFEARSTNCVAFKNASQSLVKDGLDASTHFVVLSDDQALKAIREKFLVEVQTLSPLPK